MSLRWLALLGVAAGFLWVLLAIGPLLPWHRSAASPDASTPSAVPVALASHDGPTKAPPAATHALANDGVRLDVRVPPLVPKPAPAPPEPHAGHHGHHHDD